MIIVYKRIASTNSDYTQNQNYTAILQSTSGVCFLNDENNLQSQSIGELNNSALWQLVSITAAGAVAIYP